MQRFVTTIGSTIYLPSNWAGRSDEERWTTLRHERMHLRQQKRYSMPVYAFLYLFAYFPIGFAWWRLRLEAECYAESLRCEKLTGGNAAIAMEHYIDNLTGSAYGWAFPWSRSYVRRKIESYL